MAYVGSQHPHLLTDSMAAPCGTTNVQNIFYYERKRLETFYPRGQTIWPKQINISAEEIANSGFYYLGDSDRVSCPWCQLILRDWSTGDIGMIEHKRHSPQCFFILQPDLCGNIPLDASKQPRVPPRITSGAKHPKYADKQVRLATFVGWPIGHCQRPEALAESGFFYTGRDDNVRCFYCDFGLREWTPEDDPWHEHARWCSSCKFVLDTKGADFVNRAKNGGTADPVPEVNAQAAKPMAQNFAKLAEEQRQSPIVKVVLDMGYEWELVKSVIEDKLKRTGENFQVASALMDAIFDFESKGPVVTETAPSTSEPEPSTSTVSSIESTTSVGAASQKGDEKSLIDEIERLKEQQMCKICMDEVVSIVFVPCGHMCTCTTCADQVQTCPICRLGIRGRVRAFLT